jgi:hypothetical protein
MPSADPQSGLQIIPLECPRCGTQLAAEDRDVVYYCAQCREGFELAGNKFLPVQVRFALPRSSGQGTPVYIPLWCFSVAPEFQSNNRFKLTRIAQYGFAFQTVYVEAFQRQATSLRLDIGLLYTNAQVEFETVQYNVLRGCSRHRKDALQFAKIILLALVDQKVDITGVDVQLNVKDSILVGFPFYKEGIAYYDGMLGKKFFID